MEILYKSQRSYHFAPSGVNEARADTLSYVFTEVSAFPVRPVLADSATDYDSTDKHCKDDASKLQRYCNPICSSSATSLQQQCNKLAAAVQQACSNHAVSYPFILSFFQSGSISRRRWPCLPTSISSPHVPR